MRFHADALCSFWAMMAIVMQNTAVCRVAEASLRTVRALRRSQRALQRPLRHAQSLPFPSLSPSSGGRLNEFPSLQSAALVGFTRSAGRNDGWLGHSCGFRARAPLSIADNGCLLAAFAFAQNQVKLRVRFSLNNLKLDDDVLNIPLFLADQADRLIGLALRIRGQAGIESK